MIIAIVATLVVIYVVYTYLKYKDLPPGPYGLPFVGYAPFLGSKTHEQFKQMSLKYGGIFTINVFNEPIVVVNDRDSIYEVLVTKGPAFSGRPHQFLIDLILKQKEVISSYGPIWKEQKRFMLKILQQFGLGSNSMEGVVIREIEDVVHQLDKESGKPVEITALFFNPILNIIWEITAGKRFNTSDKDFINLREALYYLYIQVGTTSILNIFPFLRFIAPERTGYRKVLSTLKVLLDYFSNEVNEHYDKDDSNDILGFYIAEIKKRKMELKQDIEVPPFDKETLIYTAFDLFDAGSETANATLNYGFLYMALWPDVQKKLQKELDGVMGNELYLSYTSRERVPYAMATLMEINRLSSVAHFGVPHAPLKDATLKGYRIPKGTMIITNLWGLHHDEKIWGDPHNFRPERFLDSNGKPAKHESLLAFGAGPRVCIGKATADLQMFLFLTTLVHRYTFETVPGKPKPSCTDVLTGATLRISDFSLLVKLRK